MNEELKVITNQRFYGGQSSDPALGGEASFSQGRALEHRRAGSQLTVRPGPRKISEGVVQDLILKIVQVDNGDRYGYGRDGNVYKITNNVMTAVTKFPDAFGGSDGMLFRNDSDALYFATQTDVRRYYPLSGTPTFDQTYGPSRSIDPAAYRTGGAATSTLDVAIDETKLCTFQPDIEPFYSIKVNVVSVGTGNWTLTLHDGINTVLAQVTINAAQLAVGQVEFIFTSQIRALVKPNARTYHWHMTSSDGTGTIQTATANDISTADYELWAYRLVDTVNNLHPMAQFQQFTLIGNDRYLAVWEPLSSDSNVPNAEFQRHRLTFPSGFQVCGIAVTDEFAVIACEKRSTNATKDFQEGKLFIWDGIAQTYNQVIDVSGGSPDGIRSHENYPYFVVNGTLCAWPGGKTIVKVRTLQNTDPAYRDAIDNTRMYPNMMTIRENMLHIAYPSVTTNVNLEFGVHSWGTIDKDYPATWGNLDYVISPQATATTTNDTNVQLGCIANFGDEMYISWRDTNGSYGLDIVDSYCDPAKLFKYRARRFDAGAVYKPKRAHRVAINCAPLPANTTLTPVYHTDANTEKVGTAITTGEDIVTQSVSSDYQNFRKITYGFDGTCTGSQSPSIYAVSLAWNPLAGDKGF
jgi:hypothetical protein